MAKRGGMTGREQGPPAQILHLEKAKDTWWSSLTLFLPCVDISTPFSSSCFGKYKVLIAAVTKLLQIVA